MHSGTESRPYMGKIEYVGTECVQKQQLSHVHAHKGISLWLENNQLKKYGKK